ncbi:MAG: hypothetical protein AB4058_13990 [Microcystaceae cyanobacterium]
MNNITFPIVIFDRHHLLFFPSHTHAVNYIKQCCYDQLSIFDSNGQVLSYQSSQQTYGGQQKLVLMDNVFICKEILLEKLWDLLQTFKVSQSFLENLSVNQLILLVYRLF